MKLDAIQAAEAKLLLTAYERNPILFVRGEGVHLIDENGDRYLDLLSGIGVNALGHAHPRMVKVIKREAGRATHVSNLFHNPYQAPLARKLSEWSGLDRVFFSNSGSEAIEGALKLARAYAHASTRSVPPIPSPPAGRSRPAHDPFVQRRDCPRADGASHHEPCRERSRRHAARR